MRPGIALPRAICDLGRPDRVIESAVLSNHVDISVVKRSARMVLMGTAFGLLSASVHAQDFTPRAYWPAPKGTKVAVLGYGYSSGDVVTDPSLPVVGVDSKLNTGLLAYLQTLSLGGRSANVIVELPYVWGTTTGDVQGQARTRDLAGFGDVAVTLSFNFLGAPSMTAGEFQKLRQNPHQILGGSLKVLAPTGDYESDKLINIGTNRWAFRAEMGYMYPITSKWLLELEGWAWFFGDNDDFLGVTREQDPIIGGEAHIVRRIRPGFWGSLNLNYYTGGRTTIGEVIRADLQENSRIGIDILYSFRPGHALKFGYSTGMLTESGGDYDSVLLAYQVLLNRPKGRD
jgi:hypothetical protein